MNERDANFKGKVKKMRQRVDIGTNNKHPLKQIASKRRRLMHLKKVYAARPKAKLKSG